jgi:hypothetical protein
VPLVWIFHANNIHREALAALALFCQAAEREAASDDFTRRVLAYLERARRRRLVAMEALRGFAAPLARSPPSRHHATCGPSPPRNAPTGARHSPSIAM